MGFFSNESIIWYFFQTRVSLDNFFNITVQLIFFRFKYHLIIVFMLWYQLILFHIIVPAVDTSFKSYHPESMAIFFSNESIMWYFTITVIFALLMYIHIFHSSVYRYTTCLPSVYPHILLLYKSVHTVYLFRVYRYILHIVLIQLRVWDRKYMHKAKKIVLDV